MKILITYFSHTGNTEKVVNIIANELKTKNNVDSQRLIPTNGATNFFTRCRDARRREHPEIKPINTDISKYDLIILATPVWALNAAPAINTYLDQIHDLQKKNIVLILVSGGKMLINKCFTKMETELLEKNAGKIFKININDRELRNEAAIVAAFNSTVSV